MFITVKFYTIGITKCYLQYYFKLSIIDFGKTVIDCVESTHTAIVFIPAFSWKVKDW